MPVNLAANTIVDLQPMTYWDNNKLTKPMAELENKFGEGR
jgi:hypothetical protein